MSPSYKKQHQGNIRTFADYNNDEKLVEDMYNQYNSAMSVVRNQENTIDELLEKVEGVTIVAKEVFEKNKKLETIIEKNSNMREQMRLLNEKMKTEVLNISEKNEHDIENAQSLRKHRINQQAEKFRKELYG